MAVFECWEAQREPLRLVLKDCASPADAVYAVRHALLQTEQNALAEQTDDVLRQQLGVLFGVVKSAVGFLETPVSSTAWVAQSVKEDKPAKGGWPLQAISALLMAACGLLCYFHGYVLGWVLALAALITGGLSLLRLGKKRKAAQPRDSQIKVTLQPDADKLFIVLDQQMRALDRCANDFAYLNESLRGNEKPDGSAMVGRIANLLEALYECDEETRRPAEEAVQELLRDMGLKAIDYSEESRKLFTTLPSKNETRTLAPAIVSAEDFRLLKRGTAAVKNEAA